jgi:hypothetical protein
VRTQGALAIDTFLVHEAGTGRQVSASRQPRAVRVSASRRLTPPPAQVSASRHAGIRAGLERLLLCGHMHLEGDDEEPALLAGDVASAAARALSAEQWEISRDALRIDDATVLGSGTFGQVHPGAWRGTAVAVKRLRAGVACSAAALELFRRELAVYHLLAHPNVVQFLGAVTLEAPLCIVTELMPGGSLADVLDARGPGNPPPLGRACAWALDCARGMRYLHERRPTQVIHRDLKPGARKPAAPRRTRSLTRAVLRATATTPALQGTCCWTAAAGSRSATLG